VVVTWSVCCWCSDNNLESLNHLYTNWFLGQHAHRTEGALHCCCPLQAMHALGSAQSSCSSSWSFFCARLQGWAGTECRSCAALVFGWSCLLHFATVVGTSTAGTASAALAPTQWEEASGGQTNSSASHQVVHLTVLMHDQQLRAVRR